MEQLESFIDWKILIPHCREKPTSLMLMDSVAFIHLAHAEADKLQEDIAQLQKYEQHGDIFYE